MSCDNKSEGDKEKREKDKRINNIKTYNIREGELVTTLPNGRIITMAQFIAALADLPNPHGYIRVANINGNLSDNRRGNLEYVPANYRVCNYCDKDCFDICSGCNKIYYCNEKCQNEDWPEHSENCQSSK